jgi:hypothetical protein
LLKKLNGFFKKFPFAFINRILIFEAEKNPFTKLNFQKNSFGYKNFDSSKCRQHYSIKNLHHPLTALLPFANLLDVL